MDLTRQQQLFDPTKIICPIHVIGAGAVGSYMLETLARMGITDIHAWDDDSVASHNIPNQLFSITNDVGKLKVDAITKTIRNFTGIQIKKHPIKVLSTTNIQGIAVVLVDSMKTRKQIWEGAIKYHPMVPLMIETRLGGESGTVYSVDPNNLLDVQAWEKSLFDDALASESLCGTTVVINPGVKTIVGYAANALVQWSNNQLIEKEIFWSHRPVMLTTKGADWKELRY